MDILTEANFELYAAQHYDNPNCIDILEFQDDLSRIKYIKRLFKRYKETNDLKVRLILNHLVTFYNVFPPEYGTKMLIFKLEELFVKMPLIPMIYTHIMITVRTDNNLEITEKLSR